MRRPILLTTLLAVTGLVLAACGDDAEPLDTGAPPGDSEQTLPAEDGEPPDEGAPERVEPRTGMDDVRPRTFEEVEPVDEQTLIVRFWSGVEPCYVLDRVEVAETDDTVTISLFEGSDPAEPDAACIEIALWKEVLVELDAPLDGREVVDGAAAAS